MAEHIVAGSKVSNQRQGIAAKYGKIFAGPRFRACNLFKTHQNLNIF